MLIDELEDPLGIEAPHDDHRLAEEEMPDGSQRPVVLQGPDHDVRPRRELGTLAQDPQVVAARFHRSEHPAGLCAAGPAGRAGGVDHDCSCRTFREPVALRRRGEPRIPVDDTTRRILGQGSGVDDDRDDQARAQGLDRNRCSRGPRDEPDDAGVIDLVG